MKIIDLTYPLTNEIKEYPGDPKLEIKYFKKADKKDSCTLFEFKSGLHTGTHLDAPYHYIINGKKIKDFKIDSFIGTTTILKSDTHNEIKLKNLDDTNNIQDIVIINTGWGNKWNSNDYFYDYPHISSELAEFLIENNIKGIAIDTCSVDKHDENKIHKMFLKNEIWIVENIANLDKINKKEYNGYFIPLNIEAEASFVRAFLEEK